MTHLGRKLFVLAMLLALASQVRAQDPSPGLYVKALDASGWVIGKASSGAGCLVDGPHRLMLTNYHVIQEEETVHVAFPVFTGETVIDNRDFYWKNWRLLSIGGKVIHRDKKRDLALIQLDSLPRTAVPLKFADDVPRGGERVFRVGSPGADRECWLLTEGKVRELTQINLTYPSKQRVIARAVVSELPGTNGHSGAAVLGTC